jgi:hypothetical protein
LTEIAATMLTMTPSSTAVMGWPVSRAIPVITPSEATMLAVAVPASRSRSSPGSDATSASRSRLLTSRGVATAPMLHAQPPRRDTNVRIGPIAIRSRIAVFGPSRSPFGSEWRRCGG